MFTTWSRCRPTSTAFSQRTSWRNFASLPQAHAHSNEPGVTPPTSCCTAGAFILVRQGRVDTPAADSAPFMTSPTLHVLHSMVISLPCLPQWAVGAARDADGCMPDQKPAHALSVDVCADLSRWHTFSQHHAISCLHSSVRLELPDHVHIIHPCFPCSLLPRCSMSMAWTHG